MALVKKDGKMWERWPSQDFRYPRHNANSRFYLLKHCRLVGRLRDITVQIVVEILIFLFKFFVARPEERNIFTSRDVETEIDILSSYQNFCNSIMTERELGHACPFSSNIL